MKSVLSIPIVTGGKTLGSCALVSTREERVWPEEYIPRLRLLAQIFTSALERQRMQEEIQNAAKEWQATFDSVQDLVMILDGEFKVSRVNAACLYFFNLPPEKVVKDYCYTLMHGTSKPVETCPLAKMLKTKRHEEVELYDETRKAWFHVSVDPILDDKGEITRVVHTVKDITERRGAEAEAFEARREMLRLERLSRMGELTASLAHELNQPLTSILSNARAAVRFLEAGKVNVEELKEILRDIAQDDKRAGDIVRSLRSMVKTEEGEMETAAIAELLGEAVSLFKGEAIIRNVEVEVDVAPSLPLVRVNRVQIQQVMINLMMNAAEAMEAEAILDRRLIIRVSELDGAIQAAFRDFGKGIDISETSRLFEPFFTTKTTGLGMGLSLSRSIMESHGGHIWAENNPDKGATFYFDLPAIKNSHQLSSDQ